LWFVFCVKIKDILRDCRKSQIMAILAISHVMKSITYKHQNHRFRVFRQSLEIHAFFMTYFHYRYKAAIFFLGYGMNIKLLEMQKPDFYHLMGLSVLGIRC
jgi:hypothetical protein